MIYYLLSLTRLAPEMAVLCFTFDLDFYLFTYLP